MMVAWQDNLAWPRLVMFMVVVFVLLTAVSSFIRTRKPLNLGPQDGTIKHEWCQLSEPVHTAQDGMKASDIFDDQSTVLRQVQRLRAAINVPTVSSNDYGDIDTDKRWNTFAKLHDVLRDNFPKVHEQLELENINKYGLLYTLRGSNETIQPVVFMAHQDVAPVADPSSWTYPPFEAHHDGEWVWGRGSVDSKDKLVGLLSSLEELLDQGFESRRTIILSFGFDEEIGGKRGAKHLAARLEEKYGTNSIAMILDEGGMGIQELGEVAYARPAVVEKGFVDLVLKLQMKGGHSSRPPPHTAIGVMARLIEKLEDEPLPPHIDGTNPFRGFLKCQAEHSPKEVEPWLRKQLKGGNNLENWLIDSRGEEAKWSFTTSQAVSMIHGGVQDNELPETVETVLNYRVLPSDDMDKLLSRVTDLIVSVAHQYNISVDGFSYSDPDMGYGLLNITSRDIIPPSPISPTGPDDKIWDLFSGTIRQVFEKRNGTKLVVPVGDTMIENTDTVHYWRLSKNIYRFSPWWEGTTAGVCTFDERIEMRTHMEGIKLYYELMRNLDQYMD